MTLVRNPYRLYYVIATLFIFSYCSPHSPSIVESAIKNFHIQFNSNNYEDIYYNADNSLRDKYTKSEFISVLNNLKNTYGNIDKVEGTSLSIKWNMFLGTRAYAKYKVNFTKGVKDEYFVWLFKDNKVLLSDYKVE
jgi:hypothetical protein